MIFFGPLTQIPDSIQIQQLSSHPLHTSKSNFFYKTSRIYLFIFIAVFDSVFSSSAEHFHFIKQFWGVWHFLVCSIKTLKRREDRENGHLPISSKLFSKMFYIWNYLSKCSCFETRLSKNQVLIWAFTHFVKTFQQNVLYLKLFKEMLMFWNSIF